MIKLIVIFASLNVLNIYCQLNCGAFNDDTCGGLTSFKSKCHQFDSGCEEIQVDDGCKFDENHNCVEEKSLGTNEKCYSYSSNNCRRIKHQCTSYIDDNCGELVGINNLKQCTKLLDNYFCVEIDIDDSCQIMKVGDSYICTDNGKVENDFYKNYECKLDTENKSCKKQKKVCSKSTSNCNSIAASVIDVANCRAVTINNECTIDTDGNCKDGATQADTDKICDFNTGKTTCEPRAKTCEEYLSTTDCSKIESSSGKTCSHVLTETHCKEVEINDHCIIDDADGFKCNDKTGNEPGTNLKCFFTDENTKCKPISCQEIVATNKDTCCKDGATQADTDKICDFNTGKTTCEPRAKTCEEYLSTTDCSKKGASSGKTCSKVNGETNCKEMTIDNQCEIDTDGNCELKANTPSGSCSLDLVNRRCKFTPCTEYDSESVCNSAKGCVFLGSCKEYTVGENCQVLDGVCSDKDSPADTEKKKCLFDNEKPECIKREKKCEDYTSNACKDLTYPNSKKKCFYYDSRCHEVELDNYCTVTDSGNCEEKEKENSVLSDTEICGFISQKECKRRKRKCEELLSEDICNNYTPINNQFCFKYEGNTLCDVITVEDGCQINSSNKCVAKRKQDGCKLDKDNKRCYKSKSGASLLSLKIFSLLFLFFIC